MIIQPVSPSYTRGQTVNPAAASANVALSSSSKQLILTNLGANVCYVRLSDDAAAVATTADYPVPSGAQLVISKDERHTRLAHISAAGTTLHFIPGEGF
jgi:hypothetical protein